MRKFFKFIFGKHWGRAVRSAPPPKPEAPRGRILHPGFGPSIERRGRVDAHGPAFSPGEEGGEAVNVTSIDRDSFLSTAASHRVRKERVQRVKDYFPERGDDEFDPSTGKPFYPWSRCQDE